MKPVDVDNGDDSAIVELQRCARAIHVLGCYSNLYTFHIDGIRNRSATCMLQIEWDFGLDKKKMKV